MNIENLSNKIENLPRETRVELTVTAGEGNLLNLEDLVIYDSSWNQSPDGSYIEISGDLDEWLDKLDTKDLIEFKEYITEVVNERLNKNNKIGKN